MMSQQNDPGINANLTAVSLQVLKDEAQYTEAPDNPPKRKSFWCWFYDLLVFLCKGKGKSNSKCNMDVSS